MAIEIPTSWLASILFRVKYKIIRCYHAIMFKFASHDRVFESIYSSNYWGDTESRSGPGSSLAFTVTIRAELPKLFAKFGVKRVFDAPCGDYVWMSHVIENTRTEYIGADIVESLVRSNNELHQSAQVRFYCADITRDDFPAADLWICRDALFHLSNKAIYLALLRFAQSEIRYLLTTTHKPAGGIRNKDIPNGDFRLIDLFAAPFCFPQNPLARFDDYIQPHAPREMCLFTREQIVEILPRVRANLKMG